MDKNWKNYNTRIITPRSKKLLNIEYNLSYFEEKRKLSFSHGMPLAKTIDKKGFGKGNLNFEYNYRPSDSRIPECRPVFTVIVLLSTVFTLLV